MWHVSVAPVSPNVFNEAQLRDIARQSLEGVGDAAAGQWEEVTNKAFHLRRRLTAEEQEPIGPAVDVRGMGEAVTRALKILEVYPTLPEEMVKAEVYDLGGLKGGLSHIVAHRK